MSMWSSRWHFTNKSITGAPYSINTYSMLMMFVHVSVFCVCICVFSSGLAFPYMPPATTGSSSTSAGLTTSTEPTAATTTTASTNSTAPGSAPADNPFAALMAQMMSAQAGQQQPVGFIFFLPSNCRFICSTLAWVTPLWDTRVWHVLTKDHTVLWNEPYMPLLPSCRASLPFGQYSLKVGGRVA